MKKYLLFASAALFAVSVNAQDRSKAVLFDVNAASKIDVAIPNQSVKETKAPISKAANVIAIGTSYNVFGILGDRQNQIVYNPAINTVAFVHRQNNGGPGGVNASGIMSLDYSTDGGATWTVNPYQTTPTGSGAAWNGNRYPNIAIFNPSGNTASANAYVIEAGPGLETGTTSGQNGWAKTFRSSHKLDGTNLDETYNFNSLSTQNDPNEWGTSGLYVTANGDAWYASTNNNNSSNTAPNPAYDVADNYSKYFLTKGVWNSTNNNFDWTTTDTIVPGWNTTMGTSAAVNMGGLMNMAWSTDGNTGYFVVMGSWGANTMYRPYVLKTTDAGATWTQYADYDFSQNVLLQCKVFPVNGTTTNFRPFFGAYDVVVDNNNQLKIFGEIGSGFTDHPDSLNYTFAARQAGHLYETSTNITGGWDITFIDSVHVDDYQYDLTNQLSHFVRPQAARSQDGSKLFYTWLSSDPITTSTTRDFPDVYSVGHDLTTTLWTPITNLTGNVSDVQYVAAYQTMAVDAIENGNDKSWELPIVFATNLTGGALSDGTQPAQYKFVKGIGFDQTEFTRIAAANDCSVAVDEITLADSDISVYPNPTNGIIEIKVADATSFNYTIIDVVGNVVTSNTVKSNKATINLSNNALGIYFVTINTNNGSITKKVMLTK